MSSPMGRGDGLTENGLIQPDKALLRHQTGLGCERYWRRSIMIVGLRRPVSRQAITARSWRANKQYTGLASKWTEKEDFVSCTASCDMADRIHKPTSSQNESPLHSRAEQIRTDGGFSLFSPLYDPEQVGIRSTA